MRAISGLAVLFVLSVPCGGCAMTGQFGVPAFHLAGAPPVVVEGLRGQQTEDQWLRQARLATPPGCAVNGVTVLTDVDATFTFSCFGDPVSGR